MRLATPTSTPNRKALRARRRRWRRSERISCLRSRAPGSGPSERALALEQALRQIFGHRVNDLGDVDRFGEYLAAVARLLQEPVHAFVGAHAHMGDGIDPQPRRLAAADAAIEQIDLFGDFLEQRVERLVQKLEPGDLGVVEVDDDGAALGLIHARLAQRVPQPLRRLFARPLGIGVFAFTTPHDCNLAIERGKARAMGRRQRDYLARDRD